MSCLENEREPAGDHGLIEAHAFSWPLAVRWLLWVAIAGMGVVLFHFQGSTTETGQYGRSVIVWVTAQWNVADGAASHGWFILPVSVFMVWRRRHALRTAPKQTAASGLWLVVAALALHWVGLRAQQSRLALFAIIGLLWGIPWFLYGGRVARLLAFPCAYLVFAVPLNFLEERTFGLRLLVSQVSAHLLNGLALPVRRVGTAIYSLQPEGFHFEVADPCSGLNSLLALLALTTAYAWLTQKGLWKRWCLALSAVPLAVMANIVRIVAIALVAEYFDRRTALTLYHDYSGFMVFAVAVLLMIALGAVLQVPWFTRMRQWKERETGRY